MKYLTILIAILAFASAAFATSNQSIGPVNDTNLPLTQRSSYDVTGNSLFDWSFDLVRTTKSDEQTVVIAKIYGQGLEQSVDSDDYSYPATPSFGATGVSVIGSTHRLSIECGSPCDMGHWTDMVLQAFNYR